MALPPCLESRAARGPRRVGSTPTPSADADSGVPDLEAIRPDEELVSKTSGASHPCEFESHRFRCPVHIRLKSLIFPFMIPTAPLPK